jgi:hypothetical protein
MGAAPLATGNWRTLETPNDKGQPRTRTKIPCMRWHWIFVTGRIRPLAGLKQASMVPVREHRVLTESSAPVENSKLALAGAEFHPEQI